MMKRILALVSAFVLCTQFASFSVCAAEVERSGLAIPTELASWIFTSAEQFDESSTAQATSGTFGSSVFGITGAGSNLSFGTGSTAGQVYCSGWSNVSSDNEKYWYINTSSNGYQQINVSFCAYGSNTGPQNFVLEFSNGGEWYAAEQYTLTGSSKSFSFTLPEEANDADNLAIRFRVTDTTAINGGTVQSVGTSRMYDVSVMGVLGEYLAEWVFTSLSQFDSSPSAQATGGVFEDSRFGVVGSGALNIGSGSTAGQIYSSGWNGAGSTNEKYWYINTSSKGFKGLNITFRSYGSNTGPQNFVLEADCGNGWHSIQEYALTSSSQTFSFNLSDEANNAENLGIRFRVADTVAINGSAVQSSGTSRMYDIAITGVPTSTDDDPAVPDPERVESTLAKWVFTSGTLPAPTTEPCVYIDSTVTSSIDNIWEWGYSASDMALHCFSFYWGNYWLITTSSKGYDSITLSFQAWGWVLAPEVFVVEVSSDNIDWITVQDYRLTVNKTTFTVYLPSCADNLDFLYIRLRAVEGGIPYPQYMLDMLDEGNDYIEMLEDKQTYLANVTVTGMGTQTQDPEPNPNPDPTEIEPYALTLNVQKDRQYVIPVYGNEINDFSGITFAVTYNSDILNVVDLCTPTWNNELSSGPITNTGVTIISSVPGEIIFAVDKPIPEGMMWSGVFNAIKFTALSSGEVTITIEASR